MNENLCLNLLKISDIWLAENSPQPIQYNPLQPKTPGTHFRDFRPEIESNNVSLPRTDIKVV